MSDKQKRGKQRRPLRTRLELLLEFEEAPDNTLFTQETLCAMLSCSEGSAERDRNLGRGVPFYKIGRLVRYKKMDILDYLNQKHAQQKTTPKEKIDETMQRNA